LIIELLPLQCSFCLNKCPEDSYCPGGVSMPTTCPSYWKVKGGMQCVWSTELYTIVIGSIVGEVV